MHNGSESYDLIDSNDERCRFIKVFVPSRQHEEAFRLITIGSLIRIIDRCFKDNGFELDESKKLHIFMSSQKIKMKDIEKDWEDEETNILGATYVDVLEDSMLARVFLYFNQNNNRLRMIKTLLHELDHVLWRFEGEEFCLEKPYRSRSHEIRAHHMSDAWLNILKKEDKELHEEINRLRAVLFNLSHHEIVSGVNLGLRKYLTRREIEKIRNKITLLRRECLLSCRSCLF
ncbi:MAG: hypothetical protein R3346_02510 [Candidatus Spechtbacterales bacterium]|nr:hypothetical protein [Candidatus Spechtbacterales bacterium]